MNKRTQGRNFLTFFGLFVLAMLLALLALAVEPAMRVAPPSAQWTELTPRVLIIDATPTAYYGSSIESRWMQAEGVDMENAGCRFEEYVVCADNLVTVYENAFIEHFMDLGLEDCPDCRLLNVPPTNDYIYEVLTVTPTPTLPVTPTPTTIPSDVEIANLKVTGDYVNFGLNIRIGEPSLYNGNVISFVLAHCDYRPQLPCTSRLVPVYELQQIDNALFHVLDNGLWARVPSGWVPVELDRNGGEVYSELVLP